MTNYMVFGDYTNTLQESKELEKVTNQELKLDKESADVTKSDMMIIKTIEDKTAINHKKFKM